MSHWHSSTGIMLASHVGPILVFHWQYHVEGFRPMMVCSWHPSISFMLASHVGSMLVYLWQYWQSAILYQGLLGQYWFAIGTLQLASCWLETTLAQYWFSIGNIGISNIISRDVWPILVCHWHSSIGIINGSNWLNVGFPLAMLTLAIPENFVHSASVS